MRKLAIGVFALLIVASFLYAPHKYLGTFLDTAVDVNADTLYTKSTWTADEIINVADLGSKPQVSVVFTFTRAAGSASTVDVYFQASNDGGTTWATFGTSTTSYLISVKTEEAVISGTTVRVIFQINTYGFSDLKLWKIDNNDVSNNITACQVYISVWAE